jgi:hypothetical protein
MNDGPVGIYLPTEKWNVYESTQLANAGWYQEGQHGGALAALVAGHVEHVPSLAEMSVSRMTLELFRVVPLVPLRIDTEVVREGKRIQMLEARITDPNGLELARALIQRLRVAEVGMPTDVTEEATPFRHPDVIDPPVSGAWGYGAEEKIMFHRNAIEVREIEGGYFEPGPGSIWMRVTTPIVAGEPITPLQRLVVVADFCNGVSRPSTEAHWLFMNPDLTVHVNRYPQGEWVALSAESAYSPEGRAIATGTLWDEHSYIGRSTQTLYVDRTN